MRSLVGGFRGAGRRLAGGESGQGLGYVLIIGTVLLIFLVALVDVIVKEMKWIVGAGKRNVLLHAADSAIDRGIYALQSGGNWDGIPEGEVSGYNQDVVYKDIPGVAYTIKVQEGNWTSGVQTGDEASERTITVFASNTLTGEKKKIQAVIQKSSINAALFSGGNIYLKGGVDVYWGPCVSYSTASDSIEFSKALPGHPIFISKGGVTVDGTSATSLGLDSSYPMAGQSVNEYATDKELGPEPVIPIEEYKQIAQSLEAAGKGDFYKFDGSTSYNSTLPEGMTDETVVFFDTCNQEPYAGTAPGGSCPAAGSGNANGVDVTLAGNPCGRGVMVVLGDLHAAGTGCGNVSMIPPANCYDMLDYHPEHCGEPLGSPVNEDQLFWEGFVYISGDFYATGNKRFYGSLYAKGFASEAGNIAIWYKTSNKSMGYLGKTVFTKVWLEKAPGPGDVFP